MKLTFKKVYLVLQWFAAVTLMTAYNLLKAVHLQPVPLKLCVVSDEKKSLDQQILESLGGLNQRMKQLEEIQVAVKQNKADYDQVTQVVSAVKMELDSFRRQQIDIKASARPRLREDGTPADVSRECGLHLGAIALAAALRQGGDFIDTSKRANFETKIREILGLEAKAALTSSDIPLPTVYSGEVVELVYIYGQARKFGTLFPLGAGTVKLPKLGTDTTWGLIASSGTVTEKSPTVIFVTFTAEKFGGLIRLPSEIDEDSIVAIGQFIARYAARQIARCEDFQFFRSSGAGSGVNGTGPGLTTSVVTDGIVTNQASTKTKQSDATLQNFRDLRGLSGVNGAALENAAYFVHPTYEALFATYNTSTTVMPYIRASGGQAATLDGFPIRFVPVMPALSSTASVSLCHALFGDATFNYLGVRGGIRFDTSREAAFTTDEILIRGLERMTVGKMATDAVAGLVTAAS